MGLATKPTSIGISAGKSVTGKAIISSVADVEVSLPFLLGSWSWSF